MKSGRVRLGGGELIIIRHGETDSPGTLNGRTDVGLAAHPAPVSLGVGAVWTSPAARARDTATALFPHIAIKEDPRLWEQDFGAWDGMAYGDLPDVGDRSLPQLVELKAEGGESFAELVARAGPALDEIAGIARRSEKPVAIVAHAGIVRVALARATGSPAAALAFQVSYLGATRLICHAGGFAVTAVNERLA